MKPTKPVKDWKHIFLDTSFIIDYLADPNKQRKNPEFQQRIDLAHQLMEILGNYELSEKKEKRNFYISAVTIAELRKLAPANTAKDLVLLFNTGDVTFIDFTKDIALKLNQNLEQYLPAGQKHQFIAYLEKELKSKQVGNARQWVSDDLKIAACAKSVKNLDAVLTSDKNTFKLVADMLELPCVSMFKEEFANDLFGDISVVVAKKK
ncbi:MAG: hypothetical protein KF852_13635 [Saprospiraceae bacterium]|nr:hypothetical protein [Saprospiraceae bacterium]